MKFPHCTEVVQLPFLIAKKKEFLSTGDYISHLQHSRQSGHGKKIFQPQCVNKEEASLQGMQLCGGTQHIKKKAVLVPCTTHNIMLY